MSKRNVPIVIEGISYPSQTAAAAALGVTRQTINEQWRRAIAQGAQEIIRRRRGRPRKNEETP